MVNEIDVSCIILCNLNDEFVKYRTIPSILANSQDYSTEIIVVDNSSNHTFDYPEGLNDVKVIKSEPFHIPKGYNNGVKEARGKYIAIFHDDCEVLDKNWINTCTRILNEQVYAVAPQLHHQVTIVNEKYTRPHSLLKEERYQEFLKECPLVMKKDKFYEVGGYDETYYFGYEDVRFSESINKLGKHIMKVDIDFEHFNGMSTVLFANINDKKKFERYKKMFTTIDRPMFRNIFNKKPVKKYFETLVGYKWPSDEPINKTWQECESEMPKTKLEVEKFIRSLTNEEDI